MTAGARASMGQRRGRPTQTEAVEKRSAIISAATDLFLSDGYRKVSIRGIAERADVSTRTVYNLFVDKVSLFIACLDSISPDDIGPVIVEGKTVQETLAGFAANMVRILSRPVGMGFARLVMNDGKDIPELAAAGYANQNRQFVTPLANYLAGRGFAEPEAGDLARLFISMAISEWNRCVTFHLPLPTDEEINRHAERAAGIFFRGAMASTDG
jgi:TetR/AcrR family transcriptional regulator, mexJK operon transcriptional repressor